MTKNILIIDGHPDPDPRRFCHALASAYSNGAASQAHAIRRIELANADFPLLRSRAEWEESTPPELIQNFQNDIAWADHIVIIFPLWLGDMPALLKAFFEQCFRPGFAIAPAARTLSPGLLKGKSGRVIITMGMPSTVYRWFFRAHSLKCLRRNILKFVGIAPIKETIIGSIESGQGGRHQELLDRMTVLGEKAH